MTGLLTFGQKRLLLENDPLLNRHFNKSEIKELNELLFFVDSLLLEGKVTDRHLSKLYVKNTHSFFKSLKSEGECCQNLIPLDLEIKNLKSVSKELFDKIWMFSEPWHDHNGIKDSIEVLGHRGPKSTYLQLIDEMYNVNKNLKYYHFSIEAAGEFYAVITKDLCKNINPLIDRERLLIAIDLLTFNISDDRCEYRRKFTPTQRLKVHFE